MGSHARLAPSSGHRWFKCPGSVKLSERQADTSSPAAIDGTRSHDLLETCLVSDKPANSYDGMEMEDKYGAFTIKSDRCARVNLAVDYVRENSLNAKVKVETKVNPGVVALRDDCSGTADVIIVGEDVIEVVDYKDGFVEVDVDDNKQLLLYLIGALFGIPNWRNRFTTFKTTIIQPKLADVGKAPISSCEYTLEYLIAFMTEFSDAAAATDAEDAPLVVGSHCKYCPASPCPAQVNQIESLFDDVDLIKGSEIGDEKIVELIEIAPAIREALDRIEEIALVRFQGGSSIKGLKVIRGRGSRKWAKDPADMLVKLNRMGVPKYVALKEVILTPTQMLKAKWENKNGVPKSLSDRQKDVLTSEYINDIKGKFKLVTESHKGEAISFDVSEHFSAVE